MQPRYFVSLVSSAQQYLRGRTHPNPRRECHRTGSIVIGTDVRIGPPFRMKQKKKKKKKKKKLLCMMLAGVWELLLQIHHQIAWQKCWWDPAILHLLQP